MYKWIILIIAISILNSNDLKNENAEINYSNTKIEDFDNIIHVRPVKIIKEPITCSDCILTTFIVMNPIRSTQFKTNDTLIAYTGFHHNENHYSTNIFDISNDYLIVYHDKFNGDSLSHYFSFSIGDHQKSFMNNKDLFIINSLVGESKSIYLIENKDSTINGYFPEVTKIRGRKLNWLKFNLTKDYLDTNLFDYISLDLLEYYLDSLDSKP